MNGIILKMKGSMWLRRLFGQKKAMGVVEVILIIVVIIGLVLIFKSSLTSLVNSIFDTISSQAGTV